MDVVLVMFKADGSRREFPIGKPRVVVGRTSQCDLRIPLSSVSRQHCELRIEDGTVRLRDMGSSNGTFHNHTRVQEVELQPGDEIMIGPVVFTVMVDGKPQVIEPVRTILHETTATASDVKTDVPVMDSQEQDEETIDFDDPLTALQALAGDDMDLPEMDGSHGG